MYIIIIIYIAECPIHWQVWYFKTGGFQLYLTALYSPKLVFGSYSPEFTGGSGGGGGGRGEGGGGGELKSTSASN